MQDHTKAQPLLTPQEEERLELALQGGLKGRLTREFCIVQATLDALQRQLEEDVRPALYARLYPLLQKMSARLQSLERLTEQTADLARGTALFVPPDNVPMELSAYLRELCANANQELAHIDSPARVRLDPETGERAYPLLSSPATLDRLFCNLFSNSVRARPDATITIRHTPDGHLLYQDNGPGLPPEMAACWKEWRDEFAPLNRGRLGMYMTLLYSRDLDWQVLPQPEGEEANSGFSIEFQLPPPREASLPDGLAFYSPAAGREERQCDQLRCLRREFAALLCDD